ncbi:probable iron-sulfur binding protein YPO1417 [hydrothermal vent metagenome]|uniref:Probable iron-sulfur binding protein YPO1417 n=1 Tax=hydrothermal vent metagenome TaxID=652676 RepID=A0A3B0YKU5_9ZZZZ
MILKRPYHAGELAVQQRAGKTQAARRIGGIIGDYIPKVGMHFIARQPMVIVGSVDSQGYVWSSIVFGEPGFLYAEDEQMLILERSSASSGVDDPLWQNIQTNPRVGLLVIEPASRQRLRVNGRISRVSDNRIYIDVERAYPNCQKYIQRRRFLCSEQGGAASFEPGLCGVTLSTAQQTLIRRADTFFVASTHPKQGVDASHRGGQPGFVQVLDSVTLRIPDFMGNNMFNTLGNFVSYPRAGLVFIDFDSCCLLQLSGRTRILWDQNDIHGETGGTCRYWEFSVDVWHEYMPVLCRRAQDGVY